MLKNYIEAWVIRDIGLTEFDSWSPVLRFATRLSVKISVIACLMVAAILCVVQSLDLLMSPLLRTIFVGCAIAATVAFTMTMLASMYMGYAVIHLARTRLEFQQMSRTDMLSGLLNRRAFIEDLSKVERGHLLIVDIDRFKQINDRFGHMAGDDVIVAVAGMLREVTPAPHLIARIGGEEFAILFIGLDYADVVVSAEHLRRTIAGRSISSMHQTITVTVSGGIADITPLRDFTAVYAAADKALYLAKSSGRNRLIHERDLPRLAIMDHANCKLGDPTFSAA